VEGKLPEIYWYVFWIGLVIVSFGFAFWAGKGEHERRHKALDILKIYAEKGAEPPPAMMDQLTTRAFEGQNTGAPKDARSALIQAFIGFLFMACVSGGLHFWLQDAAGPRWAIHASQAAMAFFGFGAAGFILAALLSRQK
jgi:hypothetical protein